MEGNAVPIEARLVERLRAGELDAVAHVWGQHRAGMLAVCRRYLRDEHLAEDAASDAFLRAWEARHRIDPARPLGPWLHTIAARHCISMLRHRSYVFPGLLEEALVSAGDVEAPDELEIRIDLRRALARLNERHRRVLLAMARGDSLQEIGDDESLTLQGAKSLLHRARVAFRAAASGCLGILILLRRGFERRPGMDGTSLAALVSVLAIGGASMQVAPVIERRHDARRIVALAEVEPRTEPALRSEVRSAPERRAAPSGLQPEDARILDVEFSPRYSEDGTVFLVGVIACDACGPILFRSTDHGRSFEQLPATGLLGEAVALPPNYGPDERRIFATSRVGLQVSSDRGQSFVTVAPVGPITRSQIAFDPRFGIDQERVVIGGRALLEYYTWSGLVVPRHAIPPGDLTPAFAPDGTLLVGGTAPDLFGGSTSVLFRCGPLACTRSEVGVGRGRAPVIERTEDRLVTIRTGEHLGTSRDGEHFTFQAVPRGGVVLGLAPGPIGLVRSTQDGRVVTELWSLGHLGDRIIEVGGIERDLASLGADDRTIIIGLDAGLRCSTDGGLTWASRC